jgi:pSer/pThr/pTyr-binding forkhead associated (FHA) protein
MPYLIQKKSDGTLVQQWQLGENTLVFGRGKDVDVKIEDPEMSKRHFLVEHKNGGYFIRDLNSINGTLLNKQPIVEAELQPGANIRAGQSHFLFKKGLGTIIGEMAQEHKGYETVFKEISKSSAPKG